MTTEPRVDLYSADTYAHAMPHGAFTSLRTNDPVLWQTEPDGPGYWALTRYEDIVTVSSDNSLFSSERGGTNIEDMPEDAMTLLRSSIGCQMRRSRVAAATWAPASTYQLQMPST